MISYFEDLATDQKFYSRLDYIKSSDYCKALKAGTIVSRYSKTYDKVDWTKEPLESLATLSAQRAFQLRSKYNYIILYFSGGSDSTSVLNTFLRNNIPIDEIVINSFSDLSDIRHSGQVAIDYLKFVKYKGKVSIINIDHKIISKITQGDLWTTYDYFSGPIHTLNRLKIDFFEKNNLIPTSIRPSNIAHLYAEACPLIKVLNNKYYVQFPVALVGGGVFNSTNVQFYISEDFPQLHIKQSHIVAKYYKENYPEVTSILESIDKHRKIIKSLIRDPWDLRADFPDKSSQNNLDGSGLTTFLTPYSEANIIFSSYIDKDKNFIKNYYDRVLKEYINTNLYKTFKTTAPVALKSEPVMFYLFDA